MKVDIVQLCHGKIIPAYSSAYALRVRRYLSSFSSRIVLSVGGLVLHDEKEDVAVQFRSLVMTGLAYLKGNTKPPTDSTILELKELKYLLTLNA